MTKKDIRWKQRFENYRNTLDQFRNVVANVKEPSDLEKAGAIRHFEFTHELAWKVMKDFLEYEGITGLIGSRTATREAFNKGLISNGQVWMNMIEQKYNRSRLCERNLSERICIDP